MKKYQPWCSLLLSGFVLSPMAVASSLSTAIVLNPSSSTIQVTCPVATGTTDVITNFGYYVAGYGVETLGTTTNQIYFKSDSLPAGMPHKLLNYTSSSTDYDSTLGQVTCTYTSSNAAEPVFTVAYYLTNGNGGDILAQNATSISINIPLGFRKA